jgi:apolipoprotein N-acyltransferase
LLKDLRVPGRVDYPGSVAKQTQTPVPPAPVNRIERILLFMVVAIVGLSLLSFAVTIVGWLTIGQIPGTGIWPVAIALPLVGLPVGMLLMVALFVVVGIRKSRENRASENRTGAR